MSFDPRIFAGESLGWRCLFCYLGVRQGQLLEGASAATPALNYLLPHPTTALVTLYSWGSPSLEQPGATQQPGVATLWSIFYKYGLGPRAHAVPFMAPSPHLSALPLGDMSLLLVSGKFPLDVPLESPSRQCIFT